MRKAITVALFLCAAQALAGTCVLKINGVAVINVATKDKAECVTKTGFDGTKCTKLAPWFTPGDNVIEMSWTDPPVSTGGGVGFGAGAVVDHCQFTAACAKTVDVKGLHYPNQSCADTRQDFLQKLMNLAQFKNACPAGQPLAKVYAVGCEDSAKGFSNGAVWHGTACCGGAPAVTIANLNMQAPDKTPCPPIGTTFLRADAATVPYLKAVLATLDKQCTLKGAGLKVESVTFTKCTPDTRPGFGPYAIANVTCK